MRIEDLAKHARVKPDTIKRRLDEILGWTKSDDEIRFIKGTRYPYEKNKVSLKDAYDRYYAVLKATSRNRFIDHHYLNISQESFDVLINELVRINYLIENNTHNPYGANAYDLSFEAANVVKKAKYLVLKEIASLLSMFK